MPLGYLFSANWTWAWVWAWTWTWIYALPHHGMLELDQKKEELCYREEGV